MSKQVNVTWECFCGCSNPVWITKPNSLIPTIKVVHCESCESRFTMKFTKMPGTMEVRCESVNAWPSEKGKAMAAENKKAKTNENPPVTPAQQ